MEPELINFFEGKSKNRRVNLYTLKDQTGIVFFRIQTKRLNEERKIVGTDNIYSYQTFRSIFEMLKILFNDFEFSKISDRYMDEMEGDVMKINTNIKTNNDERG